MELVLQQGTVCSVSKGHRRQTFCVSSDRAQQHFQLWNSTFSFFKCTCNCTVPAYSFSHPIPKGLATRRSEAKRIKRMVSWGTCTGLFAVLFLQRGKFRSKWCRALEKLPKHSDGNCAVITDPPSGPGFEAGLAGLNRGCGILESVHSASKGPVIHRDKNAACLYSVPHA